MSSVCAPVLKGSQSNATESALPAAPSRFSRRGVAARGGKFILALFLVFGAARSPSQNAPSEYQLKAAYIYHFAEFVRWPSEKLKEDAAPFVIGVLGANPFGDILRRTVHGKFLNTHPIVVKDFVSAVEAARGCEVLFVSSSEKDHLAAIFATLHGANVLTVGESDQFLDDGGVINFVLEGTKIRFQINEAAASQSGLHLSAKLLTLAWRPSR